MDRLTCIQYTYRRADRQTDRQKYFQMGMLTDRNVDNSMQKVTYRHIDRQTDRYVGRQIDQLKLGTRASYDFSVTPLPLILLVS